MGRRKQKRESLTVSHSLTLQTFADSKKMAQGYWKDRLPKSLSSGALGRAALPDKDPEEPDSDEENITFDKVTTKRKHEEDIESLSEVPPTRHVPYDFWELLGNYILPCTIGKFGAICRDSYTVIQRPIFWIKLYNDMYRVGSELPPSLQPERVLTRVQGLRGNVIRSLFHLYEPFRQRLVKPHALLCDPHQLKEMLCLKFWCKMKGKNYHFFLKFGKPLKPSGQRCAKKQDEDTTWENFDPSSVESEDFEFNPENGCCLLQIHCSTLTPLSPNIIGQKLGAVCLTMTGKGFRYQRLTLHFVPAHSRSIQCSDLNVVDIHNIAAMKILHWYHPQYIP